MINSRNLTARILLSIVIFLSFLSEVNIFQDIKQFIGIALFAISILFIILTYPIKNFRNYVNAPNLLVTLIIFFLILVFSFFSNLISDNLSNYSVSFSYFTTTILSLFLFINLLTRHNDFLFFIFLFILISSTFALFSVIGNFISIDSISYKPIYDIMFLKCNGSFFIDPLSAGITFAIGMIFTFYLLNYKMSISQNNSILYLLFMINLSGLFISMSRSAFFGIFMIIFVCYFLFLIKKLSHHRFSVKKSNVILLSISLILVVVISLIFYSNLLEVLSDYFRLDKGLSKRELRWGIVPDLLFNNDFKSFFFGYGTNANKVLINDLVHLPNNNFSGFHNWYLDILIQYGFLTLFMYVILFSSAFISLSSKKTTLGKLIFSLFIFYLSVNIFLSYNIGGLRPLSFISILPIAYFVLKKKFLVYENYRY